jgi:hypothetical protein
MQSVIHYSIFFFSFSGGRKFPDVTTRLPVFCSKAIRAFLAILPPFFPVVAFCFNPFAFSVSAICRVESSASAVKISSASLHPVR